MDIQPLDRQAVLRVVGKRAFRLTAAKAITARPVWVEPVKLSLSMPGWDDINGPRASPPLMTFSTPAGKTSRSSSPSFSVVNGVNGNGLSTIVLPVSKAGATFHSASASGKFHGTMPPTTPSGTRRGSESEIRIVMQMVVGTLTLTLLTDPGPLRFDGDLIETKLTAMMKRFLLLP